MCPSASEGVFDEISKCFQLGSCAINHTGWERGCSQVAKQLVRGKPAQESLRRQLSNFGPLHHLESLKSFRGCRLHPSVFTVLENKTHNLKKSLISLLPVNRNTIFLMKTTFLGVKSLNCQAAGFSSVSAPNLLLYVTVVKAYEENAFVTAP